MPSWLISQVDAGCIVLCSCAALASQAPQLSPQTAYKLAAACSLVFGPGRTLLEAALDAAQSEPTTALARFLPRGCKAQLQAVASTVNGVLVPTSQPQAVAAFASSGARPAVFLPWLAVVSGAVLHAVSRTAPGKAASLVSDGCMTRATDHPIYSSLADTWWPIVREYVRMLFMVFSKGAWAKHIEAIGADAALQQAIVEVLMRHCLPATAESLQAEGMQREGIGLQVLLRLPSVVGHSSLRPAIQRWGQAPGAAAAVGHVADILSLLPASRCGSMPGSLFSHVLVQGATLLAACLDGMDLQVEAVVEGARMEALMSSHPDVGAAAWRVVALLPRLLASLAAELGDLPAQAACAGGPIQWLRSMSACCTNLVKPLHFVYALPLIKCSPAQVGTWAAAVTASLRLLPRIAELDSALQQEGEDLNGAKVWCDELLERLANQLPWQLRQVEFGREQLASSASHAPPQEGTGAGRLPAQLWALHTTLCRLVAALAVPAAPLRLPGAPLNGLEWCELHSCLNAVLLAAVDAHRLALRIPAKSRMKFLEQAPR